MKSEDKETIQYITAIGGFISGVVMCFLSFFMNNYEIAGSVLGYMGEMIIFASGVFGVSLYVKTKVLEAETRVKKEMEEEINDKFIGLEKNE